MRRVQLKTESTTQYLVACLSADVASRAGLFQCFFKALVRRKNLAVDIVVAHRDAHGVRSDRHTFNHAVRVVLHDVAIFAGARLAFIRIADQILLARKLTRHETPFQTCRETGSATTTQAAQLDFGNHLVGGHAHNWQTTR